MLLFIDKNKSILSYIIDTIINNHRSLIEQFIPFSKKNYV